MANTVIALKKSPTPSAVPSNLSNGELAINYADGKLFYKHANGTILSISSSGAASFGTINANNTLVVADSPGAIVSLIAGQNITIVGNTITDTITISANVAGGGTFASGTKLAFQQNTAPTGWTKNVTHNDKAMRVVSGNAGSGGSVAFTTAFASQSVAGNIGNTTATGNIGNTTAAGNISGTVGSTTLDTNTIPAHAHTITTVTGNTGPKQAPQITTTYLNT